MNGLIRKFSGFWSLLGLSLASLFLTVACSTQTQNVDRVASTPLISSTNNWVGYTGHHIAVGKGFFQEEKVDVKDVFFDVEREQQAAFLEKKVDIAWFTSGSAIQVAAKDPTAKVVYLIDYSNGGDGIIGRGIKSPKDLKGKTVAKEDLLFQKVLLDAYLERAGLTEKDIKIKNMSAAESAEAFAAKQVDAAVSYEPYLRKAAEQGGGEVIFATENTNLVADVVMVRGEVLISRQEELQAYFKAIDKAVKLAISADSEAMTIAGNKLGISGKDVAEQLKLVELFDIEGNKSVGFNRENFRFIKGNLELCAKAAYESKLISKPLEVDKIYDDSIVKSL